MATFAKSTFNTASYAVSRPTYPRSLFDFILNHHEKVIRTPGATAQWDHAVDLGCGTGQATLELMRGPGRPGFAHITGVDPSAKMIQGAKAASPTVTDGTTLDFVQSAAEELGFLKDGSVDLVIAAQAAHWFDWNKMWPELSRVLRSGGTAAFWVYSEFRLPQYPHLTPLITEYAQGSDRVTSLGPHWEPGRRILANHLLDIQAPTAGFDHFARVFFTGGYYPALPDPPHRESILRKTMTWGGTGLHGYLRTFSALHRYHEAFPEDLKRADGDIATRFLRTLMEGAGVPLDESGEEALVEVEWPLALILARREPRP